MSGNKKGSSSKSSSSSSAAPTSGRQSTFFISGDGIDREVITTDICRYLGNDALVKPGVHQDPKTGRTQDGFYITAYRPPTSAQLADLRADSQKWREERARNSARSPGGYEQSSTQQQSRIREDPRLQAETYSTPTTYGQLPSSMPAPMGVRPAGGYETARVGFPNAMGPPTVPYNRNPVASQYAEPNYTYSQPPNQQGGYAPMDSSRDRMDMPPGQPWNMSQGNSGYASSGAPPINSGYNPGGRPAAYSYASGGGNQSVPSGYGRSEPPSNYDYGPRGDSGLPTPDSQENYYTGNDDEPMEIYDESPAQGPATGQGQGQSTSRPRERDRHEEQPRQKHRSHR